MKAYNLADLEAQLLAHGWGCDCRETLASQEIPGQVTDLVVTVTLASPEGERFVGEARTRSDALRDAASAAGVIEHDSPHLV